MSKLFPERLLHFSMQTVLTLGFSFWSHVFLSCWMYIFRSNDTIQGRFAAGRWRRSSLSISALPNSPLSHQAVLQLDTGRLETMQGGGSIDAAHPIELNSNNSRCRWDVVLYMHKWTDWRNSHSWRLQLSIKLSKRMHYVRVSPELIWDNHAVQLWTVLIEFSAQSQIFMCGITLK